MQIYITAVELILIIIPLAMLILEAFLSFNNIKGDTISSIINRWAYGRSFFITLAWGIVTGHLFLGSQKPVLKDSTMSIFVVVLLVVVAALIGCQMKWKKTNWLFQAIVLISGAAIGHLIWSMNDFN